MKFQPRTNSRGASQSRNFLAWFTDHLDRLPPDAPLPTARELAGQWNLSMRTVHRCLSTLRDEGRIIRIPGKGSFVPLPPGQERPKVESSSTNKLSDPSRHGFLEHMLQAIARGMFKRGEVLPPIKFMASQFHLTPSTVISVYRDLVGRGLALKSGKRYWMGSFPTLLRESSRKRVIWIDCSPSPEYGQIVYRRLQRAYDKMERELNAFGLDIEHRNFGECEGLFRSWNRHPPPGLVLFEAHRQDQLQRISHWSKTRAPTPSSWSPRILMVGYHTLKPHRHFAQVNLGHLETEQARALALWIVRKGYKEVILVCDQRDGGAPFPAAQFKVWSELRRLQAPTAFRAIFLLNDGHENAWQFHERILTGFDRERLLATLGKGGAITYEDLVGFSSLHTRLEPLLHASAPGTLWLFTQDALAVEALDWADREKVDVPGSLALAGFENHPDYYTRGITAAVVDMETTGYLMAHAILNDMPMELSRKGYINSSAHIIERRTTA